MWHVHAPSNTSLGVSCSNSETVVGMVHPSWGCAQRGNQQSFGGSIPPGCVWGTPLHPPPGWQGMFPNGSGPLLGSAAANCSIARCHSAPVCASVHLHHTPCTKKRRAWKSQHLSYTRVSAAAAPSTMCAVERGLKAIGVCSSTKQRTYSAPVCTALTACQISTRR